MSATELIEVVFPHLAGMVVEQVDGDDSEVRLWVRSGQVDAACPDCGTMSAGVHSRYQRRLTDRPISGRPVAIVLTVHRLFCPNADCSRRTFAEQFHSLAGRRRRRTRGLLGMLQPVAVVLAGRPGARLAARLAVAVSTPRVLGVDDFALLRGSVYATVLLDMDTHRPIDVLPDRTADTFAAWLAAHPGVEVICRDRAGAYAEGARTGAPDAIQVADRFHLWKNLGEAVEATVVTHRACLREPEPEMAEVETAARVSDTPLPVSDGVLDACGRERRLVVRTRERFTAVHELRVQGLSLGAISRQLGLDHGTVRRFAHASNVDELLVKSTHRTSTLDRFKPYVNQRWNEGCHDAAQLHSELQARGWTGSVQTLRRYVRAFRATAVNAPTTPAPPKPRRVVRTIMSNPDNVGDEDKAQLKKILARCPELNAVTQHVRNFAAMMRDLRGDRLDDWMRRVQDDDLPALHSFVTGIKRDHDAVINGLTMSWNSGPVEGAVTRIKLLKRMGYGRANLDLLRSRVLHGT